MVGALRINRHGDTSFSYAETWLGRPSARAISVSLPLRAAPFSRRESRPFFEGLLPEESQRIAIAGALSLWPEGQRLSAAAASIEPAVVAHILKHLKQKEALQAGIQPYELTPERAPPVSRLFD